MRSPPDMADADMISAALNAKSLEFFSLAQDEVRTDNASAERLGARVAEVATAAMFDAIGGSWSLITVVRTLTPRQDQLLHRHGGGATHTIVESGHPDHSSSDSRCRRGSA